MLNSWSNLQPQAPMFPGAVHPSPWPEKAAHATISRCRFSGLDLGIRQGISGFKPEVNGDLIINHDDLMGFNGV